MWEYAGMKNQLSSTSFWILSALASGRMHGYAIMRDVERSTEGDVTLRVTTLYAALERLEADDLIRQDGEQVVDGRARRYFVLTDSGRLRLQESADRMQRAADHARSRIRPQAPHLAPPKAAEA